MRGHAVVVVGGGGGGWIVVVSIPGAVTLPVALVVVLPVTMPPPSPPPLAELELGGGDGDNSAGGWVSQSNAIETLSNRAMLSPQPAVAVRIILSSTDTRIVPAGIGYPLTPRSTHRCWTFDCCPIVRTNGVRDPSGMLLTEPTVVPESRSEKVVIPP